MLAECRLLGASPEPRVLRRYAAPPPFFTGGFIPAFARCCFHIAANLLVFTSPTVFPLLPRIIPNLHPCQGVRVADDLRSGDIQKVPRSGGLGVLVGKIVIVKTIVLV